MTEREKLTEDLEIPVVPVPSATPSQEIKLNEIRNPRHRYYIVERAWMKDGATEEERVEGMKRALRRPTEETNG